MKKIKILEPILGLASICSIVSCSKPADPQSFEEFVAEYQQKYNSGYTNITNDFEGDWSQSIDVNCTTEAQAIMMYSYGGGGDVGNTRLHEYGIQEKDIPPAEEEYIEAEKTLVLPIHSGNEPYDQQGVKETSIKVGTYKLVESGLNKCKCSPVTTFSGSEGNQTELFNQLNVLFGHPEYDGESTDPNLYKQIDPSILVGKELKNGGFMSTSLDKEHAWSFLSNSFSGEFKNVVFYEIDVDQNTLGGYISNNEHCFAGKQLNWTFEYQLLLQRKMKLQISNAGGDSTSEGKNVLYLKCRGTHK